MTNQVSAEEKNRILFLHVVTMFQTAAYQHMGKLKNPITDKIERDLDQARLSIDILDMLLAKTKGNLDDDERRHLERVIRELKLNYVDEVEKDRKARESEKAGAETSSEVKQEQGREQAESAGRSEGKEEQTKDAAAKEESAGKGE